MYICSFAFVFYTRETSYAEKFNKRARNASTTLSHFFSSRSERYIYIHRHTMLSLCITHTHTHVSRKLMFQFNHTPCARTEIAFGAPITPVRLDNCGKISTHRCPFLAQTHTHTHTRCEYICMYIYIRAIRWMQDDREVTKLANVYTIRAAWHVTAIFMEACMNNMKKLL